MLGLPPRRPQDTGVEPCPSRNIDQAAEADLDGDDRVETVVVTFVQYESVVVHVCNTTLQVARWEGLPGIDVSPAFAIIDDGADGLDEILIGVGHDATIAQQLRLGDGQLVQQGIEFLAVQPGLSAEPGVGRDFGCYSIDGAERLVHLRYKFANGSDFEDAESVEFEVASPGPDVVIDRITFQLPDQIGLATDMLGICGGLPIFAF